jgi:uncharacterized lipoprotein
MRYLILVLMAFILSGCHYFNGQTISVPRTQQDNVAQLRTPPGTSVSFDTLYPIPARHYPAVKEVNIAPPGLTAN